MTTSLYERIAGPAWRQVHEAVRNAHLRDGDLQLKGIFRIRHGQGRIVRLLAWLAGLPDPGEAVPVRLAILRLPHGERWVRTFGSKQLASTQRQVADGILGERFGPFELRFQLAVRDGVLHYILQGGALCLGPLCLPLPHWFAPQVTARETNAGNAEGIHVFVSVSIPIFGLLIAYDGQLEAKETPS